MVNIRNWAGPYVYVDLSTKENLNVLLKWSKTSAWLESEAADLMQNISSKGYCK